MSQFDHSAGHAGVSPEGAGTDQARPGQTPASAPVPAPAPRPRQATTASVLLCIFGLLGALGSLVLLSALNNDADHGQSDPGILFVICYLGLAVSCLQIFSGLFVWQGKRWARTLAFWLCALNLLGAVVSLFSGGAVQAVVSVLLNIVLIRMVANDEVDWWCR